MHPPTLYLDLKVHLQKCKQHFRHNQVLSLREKALSQQIFKAMKQKILE